MVAGFASLWIIRLIDAPINPHLLSGQEGKGGTLKSLAANSIIMMATVVLGIDANLPISATHVEDPTPIPTAPRSEETMGKRGPEPPRDGFF